MFTKTSPVSSLAFTPEEVEKNLHLDLINFLLTYNKKAENSFVDIHVTTDGYCVIVEFANITRGVNDNTEGFVFMDEEHYLLKRVEFPDGHYEYMDDDDEDDAISQWLAAHPGFERDEHGYWWYHKPKDPVEGKSNQIPEKRKSLDELRNTPVLTAKEQAQFSSCYKDFKHPLDSDEDFTDLIPDPDEDNEKEDNNK